MRVELYRLSAEPISVEVEEEATVKHVLSAPSTGPVSWLPHFCFRSTLAMTTEVRTPSALHTRNSTSKVGDFRFRSSRLT